MRLKDHILIAVNEVEVVAARLADYKAKREKQGRNPSQDAQTGEMEIKQAAANARECLDSVDDLLTPKTGNPAEKLAEWQYRKARLKGLVDNT